METQTLQASVQTLVKQEMAWLLSSAQISALLLSAMLLLLSGEANALVPICPVAPGGGGGVAAVAGTGVATDSTTTAPGGPATNVICNPPPVPPSISLTAPAAGAVYPSAPATINISATTDPGDYLISKVEFYNGAALIGTVVGSVSPVNFAWTNVPAGAYSITGKVYAGTVTRTSVARAVTVNAGVPNNSSFSSQSVPTYVMTGQVFPVTVSFVNTGTATWPAGGVYRLGSANPLDNTTWGTTRVYLPAAVAPGGTATLSFNATAPATGGSYNFQWQMLQEGVAWFGPASTNVAVVVNAPPAVSLSVSGSGANAPANLLLSASASDPNDSIAKVEFYNGASLVGTATAAPYQWTMPSLPAGSYSLSARAYDTYGVSTSTAAVAAVINPNVAPTLSLVTQSIAPEAPARITLTAVASDPDGINRVEFFYNGTNTIATDVAAPYSFLWEGVGAGTYNIQARAVDNYGTVTTSTAQTITIAAGPALPAGNAQLTRSSIFDYDSTTGVLLKEVIEPNDPTKAGNNPDLCLATVYTHDSYGNVATKTTRNCNGSPATLPGASLEGAAPAAGSLAIFTARSGSTTYDARGQFPVTVTNALNQTETHTYDARFGVRTSLTGPNGLTTMWYPNSFGRIYQETRADGTYTVYYVVDQNWNSDKGCTSYGAWVYNQTAICYWALAYNYTSAGVVIGQPAISYFDQTNRKLFSSRINFAATDWIDEGVTVYDNLGRVDKTYRPYERGTWAAKQSTLFVQNSYDALSRPVAVNDYATGSAVLVKSMAYSGLTMTSTAYPGGAAAPQTSTSTKNVAGQTALVEDAVGGRIRYGYDAHGNLLGTDKNGILSTVSYDLRGRKIGMTDPDMGTWSYAYNGLGELVKQTDAMAQSTTMTYDLLGRMTRRIEFQFDSKWEYDSNRAECALAATANKTVGKLTAAFTLTGTGATDTSRIHCYDSLGRPSKELTTYVAGTTYTSSTTYDTAGRVDTATYPAGPSNPAGFTVRNVYNASAYLSQVVRQSTGTALWTANTVDAYGHVANETLGNGLVTARGYDERGRPKVISTGTAATVNTASAVQYNGVGYNQIDQVMQRNWINAGVTITESYGYDDLNQLTSVTSSLGGNATKTFWYDQHGNIQSKDGACSNGRGLAACLYNYTAGTHKLASISGTVQGIVNPVFTYDANGNVKNMRNAANTGAGLSTVWSSFNMPMSITRQVSGVAGSPTVPLVDNFNYGPEHQRIKQVATLLPAQAGNATTATLTTWYLPGFEKETNSATSTIEYKYYLSAGGRSLGVFVDHATVAAPMTPTTWPSTTLVNGVSTAVTLAAGADWRYFHQDNLGSVVAITNATGAVMEQLSYDAFGKRRNADGSDAATVAASPYGMLPPINGEDRGYTGHEMLDSIGLVHMNGRIYDPVLGRFLSADPFIQAPGFTLSYNRYAYVVNNPLVLTDPSGYDFWSRIGDELSRSDRRVRGEWNRSPYLRIVVAAVVSYFTAGWASAYMEAGAVAAEAGETAFAVTATDTAGGLVSVSLTTTGSAVSGAAGGFAGGLVASSGDLKAAAQGALSGGLTGGISGYYGSNYPIERVFANGVAGGVSSVARGGKFVDGFRSSFATSAFAYLNVKMRQTMIQNSLGDYRNDGTGLSAGMYGDGFKLAGGRFNANLLAGEIQCSLLGCQQNGSGSIFGMGYSKGGFSDMVMESFAGPHDFANSPWFYGADGTIRAMSTMQSGVLDGLTNYSTSLIFAVPFAAASIAEQTNMSAYWDNFRKTHKP